MKIYLHKNHVLYIHSNWALELTHELDQPGLAASSLPHYDHRDVTPVMYTVHLLVIICSTLFSYNVKFSTILTMIWTFGKETFQFAQQAVKIRSGFADESKHSLKQEAHGPHRSPEKTVQIKKHI